MSSEILDKAKEIVANIGYSDRTKKILKTLKLNQTGLATKLGLSQGVISEFTSGTREPSKEFFLGLSKLVS